MTTPQPNTTAASPSAVQAAAHSPRAAAARYLATGTVAIPLAVTVVVICPHELAGATAGLLAAVATAALAELPRLYWISAYVRLVKRGTEVAATAADICDLMTGLADGEGCVTGAREVPGHEGGNAECRRIRRPGAGR